MEKGRTWKTSPLVSVSRQRSHFSAKTERTSCFLSASETNSRCVRDKLSFLSSASSSPPAARASGAKARRGRGNARLNEPLSGWLAAPHHRFYRAVSFHLGKAAECPSNATSSVGRRVLLSGREGRGLTLQPTNRRPESPGGGVTWRGCGGERSTSVIIVKRCERI